VPTQLTEPGTIVPDLDDTAIRPALRQWLVRKHRGSDDTVLLEELGLCRGRVRLDMAVVNGRIHGYEIKSDRDSLRRLSAQATIYGKVLDRATLVVGDRFKDDLDLLPTWWGLVHVRTAPDGLRFRQLRRARPNPSTDSRALVELLWADQALAFLDLRNAARGVRGKPRRFIWDRICETFSAAEIASAVRSALKTRSTNQDRA
jgi:hypothetical protein